MEGGSTFIVCFSSCLFLDWFCTFVFGTIYNNWAVYVFGRRGRMSHPLLKKKQVGFHVTRLHTVDCDSFKLFFHLSGGGPNWLREYSNWCSKEVSGLLYSGKTGSQLTLKLLRQNQF